MVEKKLFHRINYITLIIYFITYCSAFFLYIFLYLNTKNYLLKYILYLILGLYFAVCFCWSCFFFISFMCTIIFPTRKRETMGTRCRVTSLNVNFVFALIVPLRLCVYCCCCCFFCFFRFTCTEHRTFEMSLPFAALYDSICFGFHFIIRLSVSSSCFFSFPTSESLCLFIYNSLNSLRFLFLCAKNELFLHFFFIYSILNLK